MGRIAGKMVSPLEPLSGLNMTMHCGALLSPTQGGQASGQRQANGVKVLPGPIMGLSVTTQARLSLPVFVPKDTLWNDFLDLPLDTLFHLPKDTSSANLCSCSHFSIFSLFTDSSQQHLNTHLSSVLTLP